MKKLYVLLTIGMITSTIPIKLPSRKELTKRLSKRFDFLIDTTSIVPDLENKELELEEINQTVDQALDQYPECPQLKILMEDFDFKPALIEDIVNPSPAS